MISPADALPGTAGAPRLKGHLLHASGGLRWHLTAWRAHRADWQTFMAVLHGWLRDWQPARDALLLIGPSAGWTLPDALFARFREIHVLEPDPLARVLLARRLAPRALRFDTLDVFAPAGLAALRRNYPEHAILFCNVLGQLAPADDSAAWCASLRDALAPLSWASWHDLVSSPRPFDRAGPRFIADGAGFETLLGHYWHGGTLEVTDHGTLPLAAGRGFPCVDWTLRRGQHHLVGWLSHTPESA